MATILVQLWKIIYIEFVLGILLKLMFFYLTKQCIQLYLYNNCCCSIIFTRFLKVNHQLINKFRNGNIRNNAVHYSHRPIHLNSRIFFN